VTAQHQIQSLLLKIDQVLGKSSPRLPWIMSGDDAQQRQVLEQTRDYLISLQQQMVSGENIPESGGALATRSQARQAESPGESAQQVLRAVVQEMDYLRSNMMQPLRDDVTHLHQQRDALLAEIKQLESRRGQLLPQQNQQQMLNEFLSTLMGRLQENLTAQVVETLADLEARSMSERSLSGDDRPANLPQLSPSERLEHIQMLQAKSDELVLKLDSTMGVVFESLQKNIQSYQESLAQGLEKMHGLGQQGEVLFAALVNRLARQLGQEASSYLRASLESSERSLPGFSDVGDSRSSRLEHDDSPSWRSPDATEPDGVSDDQLDQMLRDVTPISEEETTESLPTESLPDEGDRSLQQLPAIVSPTDSQFDDIDLALENLDLNSEWVLPDLSLGDDAEATIFQFENDIDTNAVDDAILRQDVLASSESELTRITPSDDIDALDLLNQLTAEIEEALPDHPDIKNDAELSSDTESDVTPTSMSATLDAQPGMSSPENLYSEIDELYEDMFGDDTKPSDQSNLHSETETSETTAALPNATAETLTDEDLFGVIQPDELVLDVSDDDLFAGLDDPSIATPEAMPADRLAFATDNPFAEQTLETFLFDEPQFQAESDAEASHDRADEDAPWQETEPSLSPPIETISALSDLAFDSPSQIDELENPSDELSVADASSTPISPNTELFPPASPDESLLVSDSAATSNTIDLDLDEVTLQQLTADLSQLEGSEVDDTLTLPLSPEPTADLSSMTEPEQPRDDLFDGFEPSADEPSTLERSPQVSSSDNTSAEASPAPRAPSLTPDEVLAALTSYGIPAVTDDFLPPDDDFFSQYETSTQVNDADRPAPHREFGETSEETGSLASEPTLHTEETSVDIEASTGLSFSESITESSSTNHPTVEDLFANQSSDEPVLGEASSSPAAMSTDSLVTEDDLLASIDEEMSLDEFFANANAEALDESDEIRPITLDDFSTSIAKSQEFPIQEDTPAAPSNDAPENPPADLPSPNRFSLSDNDESLSFPAIEGLGSLFEDLTRADEPPRETDLSGGQTLFDLMAHPGLQDSSLNGLSSYVDLAASEGDSRSETANGEQPPDEKKKRVEGDVPDAPEPDPPASTSDCTWFLGIDIGTTGISAVLLNRRTCELHPIYWVDTPTSPDQFSLPEQRFRLSSTVVLSGAQEVPNVQSLGIPTGDVSSESYSGSSSPFYHPRLLLHRLKPFLKIAIPHYSPQMSSWEPMLQWSDQQQVALSHIYQALQLLLTTFSSSRSPLMVATSTLSCGAVGLDNAALQEAFQDLAAVVVGQPYGWSDTYRFNIREAVLGARLVAHPGQVIFIDDAIATILSGLRSADGRPVTLPSRLPQQPHSHNADWRGQTLAINAGATTTEFALVNLPDAPSSLTHRDFTLHSIPLAGDALDQDIICQVLYPSHFRSLRSESATAQSHGDRPSDRLLWADFNLDHLTLPKPGTPAPINRDRLRQYLESSEWGRHLLDMARTIKRVLQQQSSFAFELGDQCWVIPQQELGSRVFVPYVQRLHRELIQFLEQAKVPISEIRHVVCSGGSASLRIVTMWLRQKLPQATIIQDTYAASPATSPPDSTAPACSRVAYGLASLALHPKVMELPRQRYGDYFLLLELLRTLPNQPLTLSAIMQMLESRGIDPQLCYAQVLAILEGHLPEGLIPDSVAMTMLTPASQRNPDYRILQAVPLFDQRDHQTFQPNVEQCHQVRRYLNMLTASTRQKLLEPAIAELTF
jgi:hypothetical protein